jgi:hypothetical protein
MEDSAVVVVVWATIANGVHSTEITELEEGEGV